MYQYRREQRVSKATLGVLALAAILSLVLIENFRMEVRRPYYAEKRDAVSLAIRMMQTLREERLKRGIPLDPINDPFQTGIIGVDDFNSLITTDKGELKSKLISANPHFAAVVVELLRKAGLKKGQTVAIGWTGSFPALNVSVLAAVETLGLNSLIITSVGASTWGANMNDWTWLDMEKTLLDRRLIRAGSLAASLGGSKDRARGISAQGRKMLREAIARNAVPIIDEKGVEESIRRRMEMYQSHQHPKHRIHAYINVGGGVASVGSNFMSAKLIPNGLSRRLPLRNYPIRSVLVEFGSQGLPVIHLLNIRDLARTYQLPVEPVAPDAAAEGTLFFVRSYNFTATLLATLSLLLITVLAARFDVRAFQQRALREDL